jgi:sulfate transport system ATP-binding protein
VSIELQNIRKRFGNFTALDGVSLAIGEGELVALLGPSGSGKTTLLRIIAGLDHADPGPDTSILLDGKDVTRDGVGTRQVGFVFQHYALFRHMTIYDNIAFGLHVRRGSSRPPKVEIDRRVRELLKLIQLEGLEGRYPAQLSGGQRQRIALARALAIQPKVLLLDEPFGALDAKVRKSLRRWLRRLHDEIHVTSVLVTHDQEEALEVADRVVLMNEGRIEQSGTPEEVFYHPATPFVMDFLGSVNLFKGRVEEGKAVFGPLVVDRPGGAGVDGKPADLFVRPHDLEIHAQRNGSSALPARVVRIHSAGSLVRIELSSESESVLYSEMPHERFRQEPFEVGAQVYVTPRNSHVFVHDYSI